MTSGDSGASYLLDWHRRENKAAWWEYFRLRDLPEEELFEEPMAVAGLEFVAEVGNVKKSFIHRYRFPQQEIELRRGHELQTQEEDNFAAVFSVDRTSRTLDLRVGPKRRAERPTALFAHTQISAKVIENAIVETGDKVAAAGSITGAPIGAARDLLLRRPPRLTTGSFEQQMNESPLDFAVRLANNLDDTVLAIQGPPGSGKTYTGAQMICELIRQGKRVGVTATGHKVIRNLLEAVGKAAGESGLEVSLAHRRPRSDDDEDEDDAEPAEGTGPSVEDIHDNGEALAAITEGDVQVLGGTAWLWSRPDMAGTVDVLFVDEAGQMSLANVVGVSQAAKSLVLLGDPQQLEQPQQGTHPDGVGLSVLEHVLGAHKTIAPTDGLFLPVTWRLAPGICNFTSELFYEGRLTSKAGLENQRLAGGPLKGSGLWLVPVDHEGNRTASDEEVAVVVDLVERLLAPGSQWVDEDGAAHQLTPEDIRIVAPFNAHVSRLADRLGSQGVPVGTVDKFQGQEAPIAIYSMATSRPEDAPRGMEFLYSLNRLNVATSRARCAAILVASPRLFEPDCSTPRQMKLANALCRYREMAQIVSPQRDA